MNDVGCVHALCRIGGIHQHKIILFRQNAKQLRKRRGINQGDGIAVSGVAQNHIQIFHIGFANTFIHIALSGYVSLQCLYRCIAADAILGFQRGLAKITVHHRNPLAGLCKRLSQLHCQVGLTIPGCAAGNGNDIFVMHREVQICCNSIDHIQAVGTGSVFVCDVKIRDFIPVVTNQNRGAAGAAGFLLLGDGSQMGDGFHFFGNTDSVIENRKQNNQHQHQDRAAKYTVTEIGRRRHRFIRHRVDCRFPNRCSIVLNQSRNKVCG